MSVPIIDSPKRRVENVIGARNLEAGYGSTTVVRGIDLDVHAGEVVTLLGPNGAGKTTLLMTLAGDIRPQGGTVIFRGSATTERLHQRARRGLGLITEQRAVLMSLTVAENLKVGRCDTAYALRLFPELESRLKTKVALLSGGQQQMVALARALSRRPRVLLADELSLGLAPRVVSRLLSAVRIAADDGVGVLLVEQHVRKALKVADRGYVMTRGRIELSGNAADMLGRIEEIQETYLSGPVPQTPA